jgi:hypothetical protein
LSTSHTLHLFKLACPSKGKCMRKELNPSDFISSTFKSADQTLDENVDQTLGQLFPQFSKLLNFGF